MNFLYDYKSRFLSLLETLSWVVIIISFFRNNEMTKLCTILFITASALYIFLKACSLKSFYSGHPRHAGIGMHFQRAIVGASYIMVIFAVSVWFNLLWGFVIVNFLLAFLTYINLYLIFIYYRDKNKTNPQMYSNY